MKDFLNQLGFVLAFCLLAVIAFLVMMSMIFPHTP